MFACIYFNNMSLRLLIHIYKNVCNVNVSQFPHYFCLSQFYSSSCICNRDRECRWCGQTEAVRSSDMWINLMKGKDLNSALVLPSISIEICCYNSKVTVYLATVACLELKLFKLSFLKHVLLLRAYLLVCY